MQTEPVTKTRKAVVTKSVPARKRAKRLPAAERKQTILAAATDFFAAHGFDASTRNLAETIGVRRELIYTYFDDKEALISAVLEVVLDKEWPAAWFEDRENTLAWSSILRSLDNAPKEVRLFLYAGLAGYIKVQGA